MRIRPAPGKRPDEFRRCAIRLASGRPGPSRTGPGGVCGAWEKGPGAAGRRARSGGACRLALWRRSVSAHRAGPPSASTSAREGLRGPRRVCAVLTGSGCRTGPVHLTRAARSRPPSALSISDAAPGSGRDPRPGGGEPLRRVRRSPASAGAGGTVRTTASRRPGTGSPLGPHAPRLPPPPGADRRWVVDFTRVPTRHGAPAAPPSSRGLFSRRIVGWATNARTGHRSRRGRAAALAPGYQRAHGAPWSRCYPPCGRGGLPTRARGTDFVLGAPPGRRSGRARTTRAATSRVWSATATTAVSTCPSPCTGRLVDEGTEASAGAVGSPYAGAAARAPGKPLQARGPFWRDGPWRDRDDPRGRHRPIGELVQPVPAPT